MAKSELGLISPQYLAGMVDADGCISVIKMAKCGRGVRDRHELRLHVTNTNKEFIYMLKEQMGGHVRTSRQGNLKWKQAYNWSTQGARAEAIIREIMPHLIIKHERAEVALELRATMGHRKGQGYKVPPEVMAKRDEIHEKMRLLNLRGAVA